MGKLTHTVKGPIASFRSADKANIESLKLHFLPKQEGSGDPSPTNIRPITGWTGCNLFKAKKNIIKPYYTEETSIRGMTITPTANGVRVQGKASAEHPIRLSSQDVRFLEAGKKYAFSLYINGDISGCKDPYLGYHTGVTYKSIKNLDSSINYSFVWTVPDAYANAPAPWFDMYIRVKENSTVDFEIGLQMEAGENVTAFEPYAGEQIPITFPSNGKNRYYYDEDNIEVGVVLESGLIRTIYHTHVYGNGGKISVSGSPIDPEVVSNTSINIGYLNKDGTVHVSNSFIRYQDGSVTSQSPVVPNGFEFVLIGTSDSDWIFRRNLPRYNFQIEYADSPTTYEPYSLDNTFYGGYFDPIVGEVESEWKTYTFDGTESNLGINYRASSGTGRVLTTFTKNDIMSAALGGNVLCNILKTTVGSHGNNIIFARTLAIGCCMDFARESICNLTIEEFDELTNAEHLTLVKTYLANLYANGTPLVIAYKATESVEYGITPIDPLQTFLDYNNFWTDMNDGTEVEYEFADRLAIRKPEFDTPHIKTVSDIVATFDTDLRSNLVELKAGFLPKQAGTGNPSPTNIRPITG